MNDIRVNFAMLEQRKNDNSFTKKGFLGITPRYYQEDVREIWFKGIEYGIEKGLQIGSLAGQIIDINNNIKDDNQREFYNAFLKLAKKHKCAIQYHPKHGMCVIDQSKT